MEFDCGNNDEKILNENFKRTSKFEEYDEVNRKDDTLGDSQMSSQNNVTQSEEYCEIISIKASLPNKP